MSAYNFLNANFTEQLSTQSDEPLIIPVFGDKTFAKQAKALDRELGGLLARNATLSSKFNAAPGQTLAIATPEGSAHDKIILLGMGDAKNINAASIDSAAHGLSAALSDLGATNATILGETISGLPVKAEELYASIAAATHEQAYTFIKYKTQKIQKLDDTIPTLNFVVKKPTAAEQHYNALTIISEGKMLAQDLGNEPPNVLYPESYALRVKDLLEPLGVEVDIIDVHGMNHLGMHAALAVGESAGAKPCMVVMKYDGRSDKDKKNGKNSAPLSFVGKGITMDTGGYNIKTRAMGKMKLDMCGSASVVGAMYTLAKQKSNANLVSIVGLAENRISESAYLPSAIIDSMAGFTIEVGNTDAEGRLVLADAITYMKRTYKPHTIIDLATLTGACIQAHGHDKAGFFTNTKSLVKAFQKAADNTGEAIAHDPIEEKHIRAMDGELADLTNSCNSPDQDILRAGHITAAAFLKHFAEQGSKTKWAHIDIAGTAIPPSGMASGWGVKLLTDFANTQAAPAPAPKKAKTPAPKP